MASPIYNQMIQLADQLSQPEQLALARYLLSLLSTPFDEPVTLEAIQAEHQRRLAAGAFEHIERLQDKYARPDVDLSDDELRAGIKAFAKEWEQELDDFYGTD